MKMTSQEKATAKRVCAHITLNRKFDLENVEDGGVSFGFAFILGRGRFLLACSSGHYHLRHKGAKKDLSLYEPSRV